jgi:peptidoglycan/LPS O-acetylase OafA/YrhL
MWRERALKIVLVLVGLLFAAAVYPVTTILWQRDRSAYGDAMMLSLYFTLGILLLTAVRNPSTHRSLIAFAAWSSLAHASVMAIMAFRDASDHELLWGVAILIVIAVLLLMFGPEKQPAERLSEPG